VPARPELSVIVPVRNGARSLPPLLRSLDSQTLDRSRYEVIVVDNDSRDGTAEVAGAFDVEVVSEPVANRSRARNRGVAAASTALYAFTDADCVAHPGWLEALFRCAPSAPLVAGQVEVSVSGQHANRIERFEALWRFGQEYWVPQGWAATANMLVRGDAFEAIGGFDPSWRHIGEDIDFCLRARAAGHGLGFCADAVVEHRAESEFRPFMRRCFLHGYSTNQAYYRHGIGTRAWREPLPAVAGDRALRQIGHTPDRFSPDEWDRMAWMARVGYACRVAGSAWAELARAR